ncbi:hypothetical protein ACFQO4_05310 [Saliphagus sp. GCM10025334]
MSNGAPPLTALNPYSVYDVRGTTEFAHPILLYFTLWQANILNPFLIGKALLERNLLLFILPSVAQLMLYLHMAHKSFIMGVLLVVIIVFMLERKRLFLGLLRGISAGVVFSWGTWVISGVIILPSIIIGRLFFVQPRNQFYYYEYFSGRNKAWFSNSKIGFLFEDTYATPLPELVGSEYTDSFANVAYFGDAYAQMGLLGILFISIFLGILLYISDLLISGENTLSVAIIVAAMFNLVNTGLTTSILTMGIAFSFLLATGYQLANMDDHID